MDNRKSRKSKKNYRPKQKLQDPNTKPDLDDRTLMVLDRKGYSIGTIIGAGSFGEVYKASRKANNQPCALKVIDLVRCSDKYRKKFLPRELASLTEIQHEFIIRVYDIFRCSKKILIFMEFAGNGDLSKYLKQTGTNLTEEKARYWFKQITRALQYLHEEMFTAHRDLKVENILLTDDYQVKLTDFGFVSEPINLDGVVVLSETFCGTMPYYSPQILQKQPYNPLKADIWALGVLLFIMTHYPRYPFHIKNPKIMLKEQQSKQFIQSRFRESITNNLRNLLLQMFEVEEDQRPIIQDVFYHEWMIQ